MTYEGVVKNKKIRKQFLLTDEDNFNLKIVSDNTGISQNELVNKSIKSYLARYKKYFNLTDKEKLYLDEFVKKNLDVINSNKAEVDENNINSKISKTAAKAYLNSIYGITLIKHKEEDILEVEEIEEAEEAEE